jgi:hypothetical protein
MVPMVQLGLMVPMARPALTAWLVCPVLRVPTVLTAPTEQQALKV